MSDGPFATLAGPGAVETRVTASRFLALAVPVDGDADARRIVAERARSYFDATHHCFAWVLRGGASRASDAGEPAGSAGAPILAAIHGRALVDVLVVVTRYYGGTKLGVGGLVRAYGDAAAAALNAAPRRTGEPAVILRIRVPYSDLAAVARAVERAWGSDIRHGASEDGGLAEVEVTVSAATEALLRERLRDDTSARARVDVIAPVVRYRNDIR